MEQVPLSMISGRQPRVFWWLVGTVGGVLLLLTVLWLLIGWRYATGEPSPDPAPGSALRAMTPEPAGEPAGAALSAALAALGEPAVDDLFKWATTEASGATHRDLLAIANAEAWLRIPANVEALRAVTTIPLEQPVLSAYRGAGALPMNGDGRVGFLRSVLRVIEADFARALGTRNSADAERAIHALFGVAAMNDELPVQFGYAMRNAGSSLALERLREGIDARLFDDAALAGFDTLLEEQRPVQRLLRLLDGEALREAHLRSHAFTDDGGGGGRLTPAAEEAGMLLVNGRQVVEQLILEDASWGTPGGRGWDVLAGPVILWVAPGRAEVRERAEALRAATTTLLDPGADPAARGDALQTLETQPKNLPTASLARLRFRLDPNQEQYVSWKSTLQNAWIQADRFAAARVAVAAERFRLEHGRFPAGVDKLGDAARFKTADRGVAGPFRLTVRGVSGVERIVVSAYGADGDDDGGRPADPANPDNWLAGYPPLSSSPPPPPDGDVILFGG